MADVVIGELDCLDIVLHEEDGTVTLFGETMSIDDWEEYGRELAGQHGHPVSEGFFPRLMGRVRACWERSND